MPGHHQQGQGQGQGGSTESESEMEIGPIVEDGDHVQIDDSMERSLKKTKVTNNADLIKNTIPKRFYRGRIRAAGNIRETDLMIHDRIRAYDFTKDGTQVLVKGQLKYRCNTCQSTMITKSGLFHHVLLHTGEKPYLCKFKNCGVSYTQAAGRMAHEMKHTKAESKRNSYKNMKVAEDKRDQLINDHIKKAQKSPSPPPPQLQRESTLMRGKSVSENLRAKTGQGSASSKIAIQSSTTTTTPQKKIAGAGQQQNNQIIVIESSPSPSPEKKKFVARDQSNSNKNHNNQIAKKEINHSTGQSQSQDPGQMSMSSSQFEKLKRFIQFSILESESRMMARMDDIEDKMDEFCDQARIHEGKIDIMEKKIDYLAKKTLKELK